MNCGGAFTFDDTTDMALREIYQIISDAGGPNTMLELDYPPHLTIFMTDELVYEKAVAGIRQLAAQTEPFEVQFPSLGIFPGEFGVLYMAPIPTPALLDLHRRFYTEASKHASGLASHYLPGIWVPHVTVGYGLTPDAMGRAVTALATAPLPRTGLITGLTLGRFEVTGGSTLVSIPFGPAADLA